MLKDDPEFIKATKMLGISVAEGLEMKRRAYLGLIAKVAIDHVENGDTGALEAAVKSLRRFEAENELGRY